jgi:hypothetical protein
MLRKVLWIILVVTVLVAGTSLPAFAQEVFPSYLAVVMHPGGSAQFRGKSVTTPVIPPSDVWWKVQCAAGVSVTLDPAVYYDVPGNTTVNFVETLSVDNATDPGNYSCVIGFYAGAYSDPDAGRFLGVQVVSFEVYAVEAPLDIRPASCPNLLNVGEKGVLPVAILGAADFDATAVDAATVRLAGVAPLRWAVEDVATPYEPWNYKVGKMDCTAAGPDGYTDLTLKFNAAEVMAALGDVSDGDVLVIQLTGNLLDGRAIAGLDVVVMIKK